MLQIAGITAALLGCACEPQAEPVRVLLIDQRSTWSARYLGASLSRDPGVRLSYCLPGKGPAADAGSVALPRTREEFDGCDVILLAGAELPGDAAAQQNWALQLMKFLDRGGGVAFLASEPMPDRCRGTLLERLLPVEFSSPARDGVGAGLRAVQTATLLPVASAEPTALLQLVRDEAAEDTFRRLPSIRYSSVVRGLAPDARAVLVDRDHAVAGQPAIAVAAGRWQKGRTLWVGTEETWRWRGAVPECHERFWRNAIAFLAGR